MVGGARKERVEEVREAYGFKQRPRVPPVMEKAFYNGLGGS